MQMINQEKTGTLILGYYRNGTHFLRDVISNRYPDIRIADEICNDNTLTELEQLTAAPGYKICILNNTVPKFFLMGRADLREQWHIIHLTRTDKVHHFISHWFWKTEREENLGKFQHHGTDHQAYKNSIQQRTTYDTDHVVVWLQEQLINYVMPSNARVDYKDLPAYATEDIQWQPNQYDSIELQDIFENHKEIQSLLTDFKL